MVSSYGNFFAGYSYHPSYLEKLWSEQSRAGFICATLADKPYQALVQLWLDYSKAIFRPQMQPAAEPTKQQADVLSRLGDGCRDVYVLQRRSSSLPGMVMACPPPLWTCGGCGLV